ncbi:MAG: hypothetical protein VW270_15750, partial [Candidatus Poseidoniales archaeon]
KAINQNSATGNGVGQIGLIDDGIWPFVQLYDFTTGGSVNIQYNKGGSVQTTSLTFDTIGASESLDRAKYPQGAQVHFTINDVWLNIDPTDEDSWTFNTGSSPAIYYQLFNENGGDAGDGNSVPSLTQYLSTLMAEEGVLKLNIDAQGASTDPVFIQDNADVLYSADCVQGAGATACDTSAGTITDGQPVTVVETAPASGVFVTYDEADKSQLAIHTSAIRGTSGTITYADGHTILVGNDFATFSIDPVDDTWNSGEEIPVVLVDQDQNKNSRADEDLTVASYTSSRLIPALETGDPFTIGENGTDSSTTAKAVFGDFSQGADGVIKLLRTVSSSVTVSKYSEVALLDPTASSSQAGTDAIGIDFNVKMSELQATVKDTRSSANAARLLGTSLLNLDVSGFNSTGTFDVFLVNATTQIVADGSGAFNLSTGSLKIADNVDPKSLTVVNGTAVTGSNSTKTSIAAISDVALPATKYVGMVIHHQSDTTNVILNADSAIPIVADFFSFGFTDDGSQSSERVANQIIRIEVEESGDNTGVFEGSLEYVMVNQLNIYVAGTYSALDPIDDSPIFLVIEDLTDEDAPRVNYLDLGADGVSTQIADQQEAPTHSGVVSLDNDNYKVADTVTVTLEDADLNTDSELIDIYTTVSVSGDVAYDTVGKAAMPALSWGNLGRLLDITFDDEQWLESNQGSVTCGTNVSGTDGLGETNFSLVETGKDSGVFVGDFQIPDNYCKRTGYTGSNGVSTSTTGVDIEVNYVDFRDASGEIIEVGDGAGVRANTGSITLDRTVYPVPFGVRGNYDTYTSSLPSGKSIFPIHQSGVAATTTLATSGEHIANGDLTIHIRVNDPDFDVSAAGEDKIASNSTAGNGPVKISVIRGSNSVIVGYAGGPAVKAGIIDTTGTDLKAVNQLGPMEEVAPDAGIFEIDVTLRYTDGPASTTCPTTDNFTPLNGAVDNGNNAVTTRFDQAASSGNYCILQGDILQVEYTDPTDASGDINTVTDSATFDLRNGVMQTDKSVYIIGSDIILTL